MLYRLLVARGIVAIAAVTLAAFAWGSFDAAQPERADAAGIVAPSMSTGCLIVGGTKTVRLTLRARSFGTTITRVTLDVGGGALEYDSNVIATTNFGPQVVNVPLTTGSYPIIMTVSSTGNPDVTRTGTATITAFSCRVQTP